MTENIRGFLQVVSAIGVVIVLGAVVSFIFYNLKKRDLFGGYIGGFVIGIIGALIGGFLLNHITVKVLNFLMNVANVNVIAGFLGAYIALFIMNRLNHDKERKKF